MTVRTSFDRSRALRATGALLGFADASDPQTDLLGSINRIYGVPGRTEPARNYRGTYGFITD